MDTHSDVTIVGGGLVGPLLALALADHGVTVVVLDALAAKRQKDPEFDGRAYALSLTSIRLLQVLGLWATLQDHAQPILDIKVSDGRRGEGASPLFLHFDHREIDEGPMGHMIEDRHLRGALLDAMSEHDAITYLDQRRAVALDDATVQSVGPRGGQSVHKSQLIIGCDGRQSQIAQWSGIGRTGWDYDQTSIVCAIAHDDPHAGTAHQFFTPAGPLAILPLRDNRSSIVWTEHRDIAADILSRDDAGRFMGAYVTQGVYAEDPFLVLDEEGVGELLKIGAARGRAGQPSVILSICGEHAGDIDSIAFTRAAGFDYVSCSPFRVPVAKLAAAQLAIQNPR